MFAFLAAALGPHADEEKLRLYCDGSIGHFEWFRARGVPFAKSARHIAVLISGADGSSIALVDASKVMIEPGLNLANDNSDSVSFDRVRPLAIYTELTLLVEIRRR